MVKRFIENYLFDNFMIISVIINTVTLAMDRYNMPAYQELILQRLNMFFTFLFIAEMLLKIIAIGPTKYLSDKMNYLDGSVVILSIVELGINSNGGGSGKSSLSAFRTVRIFRTFRVLRVARLLRMLHSMQVIIGVIQRSITSFIYIALLLLLFIFIFALLGMQIFGGNFNFPDGLPRGNYDSFNTAFITVFQVLTVENWQQILYDSMRSDLGKIIPSLYYVSWIFIGNFILLNLFLAILLDSFIEQEQEEEEAKPEMQ